MLHLTDSEDNLTKNEEYPVLYWNYAALQMNRVTHSLGGPQTGPTMSSRALALLHLAMHDAYFETSTNPQKIAPYLPREILDKILDKAKEEAIKAGKSDVAVLGEKDSIKALSGAAIFVLENLYGQPSDKISIEKNQALRKFLDSFIEEFPKETREITVSYIYGRKIASAIMAILAVKKNEPGADDRDYKTKNGPFLFRDDPSNPVRLFDIDPNKPTKGQFSKKVYHGPFYGETVVNFAVQYPDEMRIASPEEFQSGKFYDNEVDYVRTVGGAIDQLTTTRTPDQTVAAYYWAYDGANLIGTPPRLYNQILRKFAIEHLKTNDTTPEDLEINNSSDLVRIFALANVAMADAGKFCWLEKYNHEFWRPLTAIREHQKCCGPTYTGQIAESSIDPPCDPFWRALGAPNTNTNNISFKPNFPAYPSGHATFGAACFQVMRLFYLERDNGTNPLKEDLNKPDKYAFQFVSDELNNINRDLQAPFDGSKPITDQPGLIRTRVLRRFSSLWSAIHENAISRIYLGVHFRFDAADPKDLDSQKIPKSYSNVWNPLEKKSTEGKMIGGIPLGLSIANDIFGAKMKISDQAKLIAEKLNFDTEKVDIKLSNTNII